MPYITQTYNYLREKQGEFVKEITVAWTMVKSGSLPPIPPQKRRKEKNLGDRSRITVSFLTLTSFFLKGLSFLEAKSRLYLVLIKDSLSFQKIQGIKKPSWKDARTVFKPSANNGKGIERREETRGGSLAG